MYCASVKYSKEKWPCLIIACFYKYMWILWRVIT